VLELTVIDAFAEEPFTGNPAAVTILPAFPPSRWMQLVAREVNLSETAFVVGRPDGGHDLRWFTPTAEVDLCGHATLASAHALGGSGRFHTRSGWLTCRAVADGRIEMDFPLDELTPEDPSLLAGVDLDGAEVLSVQRGRSDLLVEVADPGWLRRYQPDPAGIRRLDARGLILTAAGDEQGLDFISRVFCPAVGVDEDPVTGSAHTTLAAHWQARTGQRHFAAYQASARGGHIGVAVDGERVLLSGRAVTVARMTMLVPVPSGT
jgi:predicted PhzF superfamily epimerase YddE/YHI9